VRALAEYVMRSRKHALIVSAVSVATLLLYWLGAAVIALTTLRQGVKEGAYIWFWCLLPALWLASQGEVGPLLVLTGSLLSASLLRTTHSMPLALIAISAFCFVFALLLFGVKPTPLMTLHAQVEQMVQNFQATVEGLEQFPLPSLSQLVSVLALFSALGTVICMLVGRAMQASLDKPGAFKQEFHGLRMPANLAVAVLIASLAVSLLFEGAAYWSLIIVLPLFICGLAIVHYQSAKMRGSGLLVFVYLFVVLVNPAAVLIVALGFIDSWVDLRKRLSAK